MVLEELRILEEFPGHAVSNQGYVIALRTNLRLKPAQNRERSHHVGLYKRGTVYRRSVGVLVARAFLQPPPPTWDSVIHLNGDRSDNRAINLAWRTRAFAITYHKQFDRDHPHRINRRLEVLETGEHFKSSQELAMSYGLLESGVIMVARYNTEGRMDYNTYPHKLHVVIK